MNNTQLQDALQIDLAGAQRFLKLLDPQADKFTFQTFDDSDEKRGYLAQILHGTLAQHSEKLTHLNEQGAGIFVTINRTDLLGRTNANVTGIRRFFVDTDGAPLEPIQMASIEGKIIPSMLVESSPDKYHVYWNAECELDQFKVRWQKNSVQIRECMTSHVSCACRDSSTKSVRAAPISMNAGRFR